MVHGLLMELDDRNCWTIAEAVGHRGPHRLQHLLSRAVWDDRHLADIASAWAAGHLDDGDAVLIVDETADEKSSADCAGAARQYSGTAGGVALCQVAVTLTYATSRGHALVGRALYLPEGCAADEEHRELAGVPEEVLFATKPHLAATLLEHAQSRGIRAAFEAGDEVYGGRDLRRGIRQRWMGYVLAVRANHTVTTGSGRTVTAAGAAGMTPAHAWQRDAHRVRNQGHPALRLGDAGGHERRHARRACPRAQCPAGPAAPLYRPAVVLPVLDTQAGPAVQADRRRIGQMADRDGLSATGKRGGAARRGKSGARSGSGLGRW
jgi:SRSO17 transposase